MEKFFEGRGRDGARPQDSGPRGIGQIEDGRLDSDTAVTGISGKVKNVYSADKAVLQFGHLRQENQDLLAFNSDSISEHVGTEISGTLGFVLLHFLDVKIDYRDNLVDFAYVDPWEKATKKK